MLLNNKKVLTLLSGLFYYPVKGLKPTNYCCR